MKPYYGNYLGICISNADPEQRGRVQVFIPHIMPALYEGWNKEGTDRKITCLGDNITDSLTTDEIEKLKKMLPWAEGAMPILGPCSPGRLVTGPSGNSVWDPSPSNNISLPLPEGYKGLFENTKELANDNKITFDDYVKFGRSSGRCGRGSMAWVGSLTGLSQFGGSTGFNAGGYALGSVVEKKDNKLTRATVNGQRLYNDPILLTEEQIKQKYGNYGEKLPPGTVLASKQAGKAGHQQTKVSNVYGWASDHRQSPIRNNNVNLPGDYGNWYLSNYTNHTLYIPTQKGLELIQKNAPFVFDSRQRLEKSEEAQGYVAGHPSLREVILTPQQMHARGINPGTDPDIHLGCPGVPAEEPVLSEPSDKFFDTDINTGRLIIVDSRGKKIRDATAEEEDKGQIIETVRTDNLAGIRPSGIGPHIGKVVKTIDIQGNNSIFTYTDGTTQTITGTKGAGTIPVSHNNPGNIRSGGSLDRFAVGVGRNPDGRGGYLVFPTPEAGYQAVNTLWKSSTYQNLTLQQALGRYLVGSTAAPPGDYAQFISTKAGIPLNTPVKNLNDQQFKNLVDAVIEREGGSLTNFQRATPSELIANGEPLTDFEGVELAELNLIQTGNEWFSPAGVDPNDMVGGALSVPNPGALLWVFFKEGDVQFPVYFAASYGEKEWSSAYGQKGSDVPGSTHRGTVDSSSWNLNVAGGAGIKGQKDYNANDPDANGAQLTIYGEDGSFIYLGGQGYNETHSTGDNALTIDKNYFETVRMNKEVWVNGVNNNVVRGNNIKIVGNVTKQSINSVKNIQKMIAEAYKPLINSVS